jgi:cytochrome c oxidase subunit 2
MLHKLAFLVVGLVIGAGAMWFLDRGPDYEVDPVAAQRGEGLFTVCASCHGAEAEGNPDVGAPRLAGQSPEYLARQLRNFRAGIRGADSLDLNGQVMGPMAQQLPDDQAVLDVAAYIATLD